MPKLNPGDEVMLLDGGEKYPLYGFVNGGIYKVKSISEYGDHDFYSESRELYSIEDEESTRGYAYIDQLKLIPKDDQAKLDAL